MTHGDFLAAIAQTPDDDAPRLVYADWLDDRGDGARAEFIRRQCRLAQLEGDHPDRPAISERCRELLQTHQAQWMGPLANLLAEPVFERGFVTGGVMEARDFPVEKDRVVGETLFRLAPLLRAVRFRWSWVSFEKLMRSPALARLTAVDFSNNLLHYEHHMKALAECRHFAGLVKLGLRKNNINDAGLRALARSEGMPKLAQLDLGDNRFGPDGARALARRAKSWRLKMLDLSNNPIGPVGIEALATAGCLGELTHLSLRDCQVGAAGVAAILAAHLGPLVELDLGGNQLTDDLIPLLAGQASLRGLRKLVLDGNPLSDPAHASALILRSVHTWSFPTAPDSPQ